MKRCTHSARASDERPTVDEGVSLRSLLRQTLKNRRSIYAFEKLDCFSLETAFFSCCELRSLSSSTGHSIRLDLVGLEAKRHGVVCDHHGSQ